MWRRVAPWAGHQGRSGGLGGAIGLGLAWGWLPCGMTYSMLLLAATTASVATGAAVMLAFGLGTLPSMVTAGVAFERIARGLATRATLRNVAGALLLAFGLWTAGNALWHLRPAPHAGQDHGQEERVDHRRVVRAEDGASGRRDVLEPLHLELPEPVEQRLHHGTCRGIEAADLAMLHGPSLAGPTA